MNRTPLPDEPPLATALRACADGLYPAEAAAEFLISHASWLCRDDFRDGYVGIGTSITDGITAMAAIDWPAAITALDEGSLPQTEANASLRRPSESPKPADKPPASLRPETPL